MVSQDRFSIQKAYQRERTLVAVYELADLRLDNWPRRESVPGRVGLAARHELRMSTQNTRGNREL